MNRRALLLCVVAAGIAASCAQAVSAQDQRTQQTQHLFARAGDQNAAANPPSSSNGGIDVSALAGRSLPVLHAGQQVEGLLTANSVLRADDTYMNGYYYDGTAGERITVTLRSPDFDSWLVIDQPDGPFRQWDDDSGGGRDARLTVTFPATGRYLIVANAVAKRSTGRYTLRVDQGPPGETVAASSTAGIDISALAGRSLPILRAGQQLDGTLTPGSVLRSDDTYMNGYYYDGVAGEQITITLRSPDFDSWLVIDQPDGPFRKWDDDSGGGQDSKLAVTLPATGRYIIAANSVGKHATGRYTLRVDKGN